MKHFVSKRPLKQIIKTNINNKKLKQQYKNARIIRNLCIMNDGYIDINSIFSYEDRPNLRNSVCRNFSTKQESSVNMLHDVEYSREYGKFLRSKRSFSSLANANDDLVSGVYAVEKCWKNNSKRPNQYYK